MGQFFTHQTDFHPANHKQQLLVHVCAQAIHAFQDLLNVDVYQFFSHVNNLQPLKFLRGSQIKEAASVESFLFSGGCYRCSEPVNQVWMEHAARLPPAVNSPLRWFQVQQGHLP